MTKLYVLKDLNDPTKLKAEYRSSASGTICELPEYLIGKSWKIVDGSAILDSEANDIRLAAELVAETNRKMDEMRAERNRRLSETDHTQLSDTPFSDAKKNEYKVYRQALRDLPSVVGDFDNFDYPVKPE